MIERDYIMRMLSQLVQMLTRVLVHKKAYDYPQAKREIEGAYKSLLGVSADFIRTFSDIQLIEMFGKDVETAGAKWYILGALLKEEADIHQISQEDDKSIAGYTKALSLLLTSFLDLLKPIESHHVELIEDCVQQLKAVEMPLQIMEKLFLFYEQSGRYDKAENILFDLVKSDVSYKERGFAFYERLLKKTSEELRAGGLPRNEVLDGIENLKLEIRS